MTTDRDVTRIVQSWLSEDDHLSADRVLDAVLDQIVVTPQRRFGWVARRFPIVSGNRFRLSIAAALVVVAALFGFRLIPAAVGDPPPAETPSFTSERHAYALVLDDEAWAIIERPGEWPPGTTFTERSTGIDYADRIGESEPYILIASQLVPSGMSREAWLAQYDAANALRLPHCSPEESATARVDGEEARITRYLCSATGPESLHGLDAVMMHGDRAYVVRVFDFASDTSFDLRPLLDEFLDAFRFGAQR